MPPATPAPLRPPPATPVRGGAPSPAVPRPDLARLKQELKDTRAIGLFTKITLKNQMDDLLDLIRRYHLGQRQRSLTELRRSYDLLLMKVLSLVQDEDRTLTSDILASREAIWALLADPSAFAALQL